MQNLVVVCHTVFGMQEVTNIFFFGGGGAWGPARWDRGRI